LALALHSGLKKAARQREHKEKKWVEVVEAAF